MTLRKSVSQLRHKHPRHGIGQYCPKHDAPFLHLVSGHLGELFPAYNPDIAVLNLDHRPGDECAFHDNRLGQNTVGRRLVVHVEAVP